MLRYLPCLLLLAIAASVGCSSNNLGVSAVTGTVTMDQKPLAGGRVQFFPTDGRPSSGVTDASGTYELNYIRDVMGAEPGQHKVRITTDVLELPNGRETRETIPTRYNRNTELMVEVKEGSNVFDFDLKSK